MPGKGTARGARGRTVKPQREDAAEVRMPLYSGGSIREPFRCTPEDLSNTGQSRLKSVFLVMHQPPTPPGSTTTKKMSREPPATAASPGGKRQKSRNTMTALAASEKQTEPAGANEAEEEKVDDPVEAVAVLQPPMPSSSSTDPPVPQPPVPSSSSSDPPKKKLAEVEFDFTQPPARSPELLTKQQQLSTITRNTELELVFATLQKFQRICRGQRFAVQKALRGFVIYNSEDITSSPAYDADVSFAEFYLNTDKDKLVAVLEGEKDGLLTLDLLEWTTSEQIVLRGLASMMEGLDNGILVEEATNILAGGAGHTVPARLDFGGEHRVPPEIWQPLHQSLAMPEGVVHGESLPMGCWVQTTSISPQDSHLLALLQKPEKDGWGFIRKIAPKPELEKSMRSGTINVLATLYF
jgi:hypothetical protein